LVPDASCQPQVAQTVWMIGLTSEANDLVRGQLIVLLLLVLLLLSLFFYNRQLFPGQAFFRRFTGYTVKLYRRVELTNKKSRFDAGLNFIGGELLRQCCFRRNFSFQCIGDGTGLFRFFYSLFKFFLADAGNFSGYY